jgi:hypothetical protein
VSVFAPTIRLNALVALLVGTGGAVGAAPVTSPPLLPAPSGPVIAVSTEAQLQAAVRNVGANGTILIAAGTYRLTSTLYFNGTYTGVTIRGATNNRDDVVLVGSGMSNSAYGATPYGIWTGGNVSGITIANLTIRDIYYHPVIFNAGTEAPRVYNVHLINAGQQFLKANPDATGGGVDTGVVEYCVFEYETTAKDSYTNGVDVHTGRNWIVRNNLFKRIQAPAGQLAGPAVIFWNGSQNPVTEGNAFVDCQREIAYGLIERTPYDNVGGVVRNNFIYRGSGVSGDVAIGVGASPNTQVVHNTVLGAASYGSAIEYRFAASTGVVIANNLTDAAITARDGASASVTGNYTRATSALFVAATTGDLHLLPTAAVAIDRGTVLSNCTSDWDGAVRPHGAAADLGADELGAIPPAAPTNVRIIAQTP